MANTLSTSTPLNVSTIQGGAASIAFFSAKNKNKKNETLVHQSTHQSFSLINLPTLIVFKDYSSRGEFFYLMYFLTINLKSFFFVIKKFILICYIGKYQNIVTSS